MVFTIILSPQDNFVADVELTSITNQNSHLLLFSFLFSHIKLNVIMVMLCNQFLYPELVTRSRCGFVGLMYPASAIGYKI